jgi:hypothetical protein
MAVKTKRDSGIVPVIVCGVLIVLSVLLVIVGHRQSDANAIVAATATARAAASAPPKPTATINAAAASALAKPAAAD